MDKASQQWISRSVELGCIACEADGNPGTPAEYAHAHEVTGAAQRAPHTLGFPLCPAHHRTGEGGVASHHGSPALFEKVYGSWADLLHAHILRMARAYM